MFLSHFIHYSNGILAEILEFKHRKVSGISELEAREQLEVKATVIPLLFCVVLTHPPTEWVQHQNPKLFIWRLRGSL